MAKLLRHLGLGGKKSPSPQSRHTEYGGVQGHQSSKAPPGTDRCSGTADEGGRFDSLRETDTRRHSECSSTTPRTLPLSFDSAATTRERDWSLRGPNSKDLPPGTFSPVDDPSPARLNLSGQEEVLCPTPAVAAEVVAGEEPAQVSSGSEVQLSNDYSNPYDLKKEIAVIVEPIPEACVMEPSSEDDYSVPYELKKHFKDLHVEEEPPAVAMKPKYDDPYELSPADPSPPSTVQPTTSGQPVSSLGHYRNLPMVASSTSAGLVQDTSSVLTQPMVTKPPETSCVANNGETKVEDPCADDDDHENYMDLQEEEIFLPKGRQEFDSWRTAPSSVREACINACTNNYDEPWDLANTRRDLEERLRAAQKLESSARRSAERAPQPVEVVDDRPQEGYDKPWDLQPHMKDDRGQEGYDKPWDLKPHLKDMRPAQEYEMPWDKKARDIERDLIAAKRAKDAAKGGDGLALVSGRATPPSAGLPPSRLDASRMADTRPVSEYDEPWDQKKKKLVCKAASEHALMSGHFPSGPAGLPFPQQMSGASGLPFPQQAPSRSSGQWGKTIGERIDPKLPLEQQSWYHGSISRVDAENLLRVHREGSYLVRTSESNKLDYSLSVKSIRGFMHMKIVTNADGRYILGQFSQPFYSIPQMIYHYTVNKLPIKGAEHMSLMYPISNELL